MISEDREQGWLLLVTQVGTIVAGLVILALMPPTAGGMMLIPMTSQARAALIPLAAAHGALLVAQGPLPGSFVIDGKRSRIAATMYRHGIVVLAAPLAGCRADIS